MRMRPDRFALDLLLDGPRPINSTALFADVWRYLSPQSELHGRPQQRLCFGLLYPSAENPAERHPRLRLYSTDPDFSVAITKRLLIARDIMIGRQSYRIVGQAAVQHLDAEYVDLLSPIIIKTRSRQCVTHHEPIFHDRLQVVMRNKLLSCGFHHEELPTGPLVTMMVGRYRSTQIKEQTIFLPGSVGRFQLHGSPDVRRAMVLSGFGVKTGMGFGFAVPVR